MFTENHPHGPQMNDGGVLDFGWVHNGSRFIGNILLA